MNAPHIFEGLEFRRFLSGSVLTPVAEPLEHSGAAITVDDVPPPVKQAAKPGQCIFNELDSILGPWMGQIWQKETLIADVTLDIKFVDVTGFFQGALTYQPAKGPEMVVFATGFYSKDKGTFNVSWKSDLPFYGTMKGTINPSGARVIEAEMDFFDVSGRSTYTVALWQVSRNFLSPEPLPNEVP